MHVTLWRHGEAGAASRDADRALTERGRDALVAALPRFKSELSRLGVEPPNACLHSPLVRTTQTAELLATDLAIPAKALTALAPGARVAESEVLVEGHEAHVILVTHQPFVSDLLGYWLDNDGLDFLGPGGWATIDLLVPSRGGASLKYMEARII